MAKQTIVIESAKDLSLQEGMIVITDRETGEISLRSLEDVRMELRQNIKKISYTRNRSM